MRPGHLSAGSSARRPGELSGPAPASSLTSVAAYEGEWVVTDEDVEQTAGPESTPEPGRPANLVAWGAVALIILGAFLGAWAYLRWEDTLDIPLLTPLVAKIGAVALVFTGGALLSSVGARTTGVEDSNGAKEH